MSVIKSVFGTEILDSRGTPTIQVKCILDSGIESVASVPSGKSTGTAEALEKRDLHNSRYRGKGCKLAVQCVNEEIHSALTNKDFSTQETLDHFLINLDGTPNKSNLGANSILGVSLAFSRAMAMENKIPLYQHYANMLGLPLRNLPRPTVNLFSGGHHAGWQVPIQDVLVLPLEADTMDESLALIYEVYQCAAELCADAFNVRPLSADEGGLAPDFETAEQMLEFAVLSIEKAGIKPGKDMALAVDVASSHFYQDGVYQIGADAFDANQMIEKLNIWCSDYYIASIEDGLSEDDWGNWPLLNQAIGENTLVLGDDFLCTNPERIQRAIDTKAANALLLKVNQIGTLTEAKEAYQLARSADWHVTISARSGETEDNWLADLAVGWNGDHIKVGSITQSERLAKYNRLLVIEEESNLPLVPIKQ